MKKINIAIDGYSSTGKSTVAKRLSKALGYVYIDSGAMYRAVTLYAIKQRFIQNQNVDFEHLIASLKTIAITFRYNDALGFSEIYLNGENVENEIRTLEVSNLVSKIAEISEIRRMLVDQQQAMGKQKGVVMDGRDIGTVVFPDAELKIFMTAPASIRAERRYRELLAKHQDVSYEDVLANVISRDTIDSNRKDSPLAKADDAVVIDNSDLSEDAQFSLLFELANKAIHQN
ncbi:MAG TPA: (d)CMP kinase [Aquaticitalea sp.]|nr:(d)CMP kinase [Aquaticitalea sp.]